MSRVLILLVYFSTSITGTLHLGRKLAVPDRVALELARTPLHALAGAPRGGGGGCEAVGRKGVVFVEGFGSSGVGAAVERALETPAFFIPPF